MVDRSMMDRMSKSMMDRVGNMGEGMVYKGFVCMCRNRGMGTRSIFFFILVLVDLIRGSGRLGVDGCMVTPMGFVDRRSHSRCIAMFNKLVAMLVGSSQSQKW